MKHEEIIKRPDGTSVKIEVEFCVRSFLSAEFRYQIMIFHRQPKKIKWVHHPMKIGVEENPHCTSAEIKSAKMELWNKLKP